MSFCMGSAIAAIATLSSLGSRAHAEVGGNNTLSIFQPAIDSRGYLTVNASQVLGHKDVSFGLGSLDYGRGLLKFGADTCGETSGEPCYRVDNIITATIIAAFGVKAGPIELEIGASEPL